MIGLTYYRWEHVAYLAVDNFVFSAGVLTYKTEGGHGRIPGVTFFTASVLQPEEVQDFMNQNPRVAALMSPPDEYNTPEAENRRAAIYSDEDVAAMQAEAGLSSYTCPQCADEGHYCICDDPTGNEGSTDEASQLGTSADYDGTGHD